MVTSGLTRMPTATSTPLFLGDRRQPVQLLDRLDVQMPEPGADGLPELGGRLPHPAEDDPLGGEARRERPGHLAGGDDVGARAQIAEDAEHGERAVGLDRVADPMRHAASAVSSDR